jgi:hypothetical protein
VLVKALVLKVQRQIISAILNRKLLTRRSSRYYIVGLRGSYSFRDVHGLPLFAG